MQVYHDDDPPEQTPNTLEWMHLALLARGGSLYAAAKMTALLAVLVANVVECHNESET